MPTIMWQLLAQTSLLIALIGVAVEAKFYAECHGVDKENKFVSSWENCARYIYCDGLNSFEGECLDDNYFNEFEGKCDERAAVMCKVGHRPAAPNTDGGRLDGSNNIFSIGGSHTDPSNGNGNWDAFASGGWSGLQLVTSSSGLISTGGQAGLTTTTVAPQCPLRFGLSNIVYLPSVESCAAYYTCYNGIAIPMICPRYTYFNHETSHCERQEHVYCALDRPVRLICNKGVYDYIPHPRNCGYYYFCSNGYLMIFQCPFQYTWHYERRTCVHPSQSKCFSSTIAQAMLE